MPAFTPALASCVGPLRRPFYGLAKELLPVLPLSQPNEGDLVRVPFDRHAISPFHVAKRLFFHRLRPTPGRGIDLNILQSIPPCSRHGRPLQLNKPFRDEPLLDCTLGYLERELLEHWHTPSTFMGNGGPKNGHTADLAFLPNMSRSWMYG